MERLFDIILSCFALVVFSPFLICVIIILKFTGEGQVFFLQERVGRSGNIFNLYKFATMLKDSPNLGSGTITIKDDPRVLPFGKFLRVSKINEIPQLINILLGDMSIIGPRPLTQGTFHFYSENTKKIIKKMKPGLSGIGSIIFRGEEMIMQGSFASKDFYNSVILPYKGNLEEWYFSKKNLFLYFVLIILTVIVVLFPSSKIIWKIFKDLPKPPSELKRVLNF